MIFRSPYSRLLAAGASLLLAGTVAAVAAIFPEPTVLVSRPGGDDPTLQGNGDSSGPVATTYNGRLVAFSSFADNLFGLDSNPNSDIFVRDLASGFTSIVSLGNPASGSGSTVDNRLSANGDSRNPSISPDDGRFVAFESDATNLVTGDTNAATDVFVRDRFGDVIRASVGASTGQGPNGAGSFAPSIADPQPRTDLSGVTVSVAYHSAANNLDGVENPDNAAADVFVTTLGPGFAVGGLQVDDTRRISVAADGSVANGDSRNASISADGRFVAFQSTATNLVPDDTNPFSDIFVADTLTGSIELISAIRDDLGAVVVESDGDSALPYISPNGRYVAYVTDATIFDGNDLNGFADVYVHDRLLNTTVRASIDSFGGEGDADSGLTAIDTPLSYRPSVSDDGRFVVFTSQAENLDVDGNLFEDVFLHDFSDGSTQRISIGPSLQEDGASNSGVVSGNSSQIIFASEATNIISDDNNLFPDVFAVATGVNGGGGQAGQPVADAGPDTLAFEFETVQLDGTASFDPDGDPIVSYQWTQIDGPPVQLSDPTSSTPTFQAPPVSEATFFTFSLVVSDGVNTSDEDLVDVLVDVGLEATVIGQVLDGSGNPVVGALVRVVREEDGSEAPEVETDGAGFFNVQGVRPGTNVVTISAFGFEPYISDPTDVGSGELVDLGVIDLPGPTASLVGTVLLRNGQPVEGAIVRLRAGADVIEETLTDSAGEYRLEDLDSLELAQASALEVETEDLPVWSTSTFPRNEGVENTRNFRFGRLEVTIDARPATRRKFLNNGTTQVVVRVGAQIIASAPANARVRRVIFPNLPAGPVKIQATNSVAGAASANRNIPEGGTIRQNLIIRPVRF